LPTFSGDLARVLSQSRQQYALAVAAPENATPCLELAKGAPVLLIHSV
jgi:hypothetical protein